jgi:hypothetical protein
MIMKKVFSENGTEALRFKKDAKDQIVKWLGDIDYNYAIKFAKEVDCPVFGKAVEFPCVVIEGEL